MSVEFAKGKMLLLVDEVDRAALNALSQENGKVAYTEAMVPIRALLGQLKKLVTKYSNLRYLIVGITPVSTDGFSIFNHATALGDDPDLANIVGFTETEVKAAIVWRFPVLLEAERANILAAFRLCYNGYSFLQAPEAVYNSQLVLYGLNGLTLGNITLAMCASPQAVCENIEKFLDPNQRLSLAAMRLGAEYPHVQAAMLQLCCARGTAASVPSWDALPAAAAASDPETEVVLPTEFPLDFDANLNPGTEYSYLYYIGLATLTVSATGEQALVVPNQAVQESYLKKLFKALKGKLGTVQRFLSLKNAESLTALVGDLIRLVPPSVDQTEADLQCLLVYPLSRCQSNVKARAEPHPVVGSSKRIDVLVEIDGQPAIIIELKTIACMDSTRHQRLKVLLQPGQSLRPLRCQSRTASSTTVDQVHTEAETQVSGYLATVAQARPDAQIVAFAVTQVFDQFVVSQVL